MEQSNSSAGEQAVVDLAIVGAGFAGMYQLIRARRAGLSAVVVEAGDDVGGTWYWNRYPGARCDVQSVDYSYSFDPELDASWVWSEKYATQPEILRYAQHVADRFDLRRDIRFSTRLVSACWDDSTTTWTLDIASVSGELTGSIQARFFVMATGCLSVPKEIDIAGTERFAGPTYLTGRWPHEGVDFTGQRVAVIGTGSSAIQSIPLIAAQAAQVTVFQRTANFSIPAGNGPIPDWKLASVNADRAAFREAARWTGAGVFYETSEVGAVMVTDEERTARYQDFWDRGEIIPFLGSYNDHLLNPVSNEALAEFVRAKVRAKVSDPAVAELLSPRSFPIGTKRLCLDTNYYETFNQPHVRLVDLNTTPIASITETGVQLGGASSEAIEFDSVVFATGFDAMTGAIVSVDITGRDGRTLQDEWAGGPVSYLGLMAEGFPNLFMITGPGSPSVLSNMMVSIEQHVDWIADAIARLQADGHTTIEPTTTAVDGWVQHTADFADITLLPQANSWYMGANVPGKTRVFLPYPGGVDRYRTACVEVVERDYLGFTRSGPHGSTTVDGVVRSVAPDVSIMLELLAELGVPPLESLGVDGARMMYSAGAMGRPAGPQMAEIVDGTFPGADGPLAYRLFRPQGEGSMPVVVYFHGGGWVLGDVGADDPFCRSLAAHTGSIVISCDYRHAPENRFPGAFDDAIAAVRWATQISESLGGNGRLAVAGWSAGGQLAASVSAAMMDDSSVTIDAQLLITPVTDALASGGSLDANAEGFFLTASVMRWFFDQYVDVADRADVRVSPLRAQDVTGLPPTVVVTAEFDPLCDQGNDYAARLVDAGVPVHHVAGRGQVHTGFHAVDLLISPAPYRLAAFDAFAALMTAPATVG